MFSAQDAFELGEGFGAKISQEARSKIKTVLVRVNIDDLLETLLEFMLTFVKPSTEPNLKEYPYVNATCIPRGQLYCAVQYSPEY